MISLPNVTLFAVACTKIPETINALKKSMKEIDFAEAILITHEKISLDEAGIKVVNVEKLDYKGYNEFILLKVRDYIKTEYALLVQNDGYVLRPQKWNDKFFNYDYIGAPWRKNIHFTKDGTNIRVGNGGFSFRSKKLLNAFVDLNLPFTDNGTGFWHEDGNISVYHRKALEEAGIKFAPVELAAKFSHEDDVPESVYKSFGFHGTKIVFPSWMRIFKKILKKLKIVS